MPAKPSAPIFSLTGVRGMAAIGVILFHIEFQLSNILGYHFVEHIPIISEGFRGVDLFFILSGFIMMHVHRDDFHTITGLEFFRFVSLRAIRSYPLNIVVLLLIFILVAEDQSFVAWYRHISPEYSNAFSPIGFLQSLFLANRWIMPDYGEWNAPVWSLSIEFIAYPFFPALAFVLLREKSWFRSLLYSVVLIASLVVLELSMGLAETNIVGRFSIIRVVTCFPAGVALYRFVCLAGAQADNARWASWGAFGSCIALLLITFIRNATVLAPFCFSTLIASLFYQSGTIDRILRSRTAIFLGNISFALYLVHFVPLSLLCYLIDRGFIPASGVSITASLAVFMLLCVAISAVLHYLVERPAQRIGRRLLVRLLST